MHTMNTIQSNVYLNFVASLETRNISRVLPNYYQNQDKHCYLDFSSNDYLQFSQAKIILKSAVKYAKRYGMGSTGSRLLSGNKEIFQEFEKQIAQSKKTDKALLFTSGFQANLSVLSALLDINKFKQVPLVFFDKLNHKSLYEAVKLSGAKLVRYAHNDMSHLSFLLDKFKKLNNPKFIVAESLYGMDGDILKYEMLVNLARQYQVLLYLDEAHATGILGKQGYGLSTQIDFMGLECVIMGTFSKALGGSGAYVACSNSIYQYLINCCSGFIYSTACSPVMIGAMVKAWELVPDYRPKVFKMLELAQYFRDELKKLTLHTGASETHIVPIIYPDAEQALKVKHKLQANNIFVSFVQYPTVPKNQARIRIALNIAHKKRDIDMLLGYL
jgi:8-amino-7-oxononanoate synthase